MVEFGIRLCAMLLALAPALIIAFYVWSRRTPNAGPEFIAISLGLGSVVVLLAIGIELVLDGVVSGLFDNAHVTQFVRAFVAVALTEEAAKFTMLLFIVMRHEDCRTPFDVMCGSILISLGFAALENILFIVGSSDWYQTGLLRSLTAVPEHAILGILMGYFCALATLHEAHRQRYLMAGLFTATVFHGFYDWPLFALSKNTNVTMLIIAYWTMFCLVLVVGGVIAFQCLESPKLHPLSTHEKAFSPNPFTLGGWRPSPLFWQITGFALICAGVAAPIFGYASVTGNLPKSFIIMPAGILPVIFGYSFFRFGTRAIKTI